jgi:acyl dehydratase
MSIWDEHIPVGKKYVSLGRTITDGDFSLLTNVTWTVGRIHTDREYMKKHTQFRDMILGGPIVVACAAGMEYCAPTNIWKDLEAHGILPVGMLGYKDMKFLNPVLPGDTITGRTEVLSVRPTKSNPKRAVLNLQYWVSNQKDEKVTEWTSIVMVESTE